MNKREKALFVLLLATLIIVILAKAREDCGQSIYVVITIDTERDVPPLLNSFKGMDEGMPLLLELLDKYGVAGTFFVTGNVAVERPDAIKEIAENHEIGNHGMYHLEALYTLSYEEKYKRVESSTILLEELIGRNISSFRAPGHSCDTELINILEGFGYTVESSAYKKDSYPYHPSRTDWTAAGTMEILRIPVSNMPEYFYPFFCYGESWITAYNYVVASQSEKDKILVVVGLHSWEFCEMDLEDEYYATQRICGTETYEKLEELLLYLQQEKVKFITLSEAYELFK